MKLFQKLLITPALFGLLTPLASSANEINLADVSNYSSNQVRSIREFDSPKELSIQNESIDILESQTNNFEAGAFSETTTASFSADMYLGAVDGGTATTDDAVMAGYSFQIDLNTTFTGEDSLDVSIDAGNAGAVGIAEFDGNSTTDKLTVDGVSYTFPIGAKTTAFIGDNTDGSLLFNTACVYSGPSNTLDDCGNNYSAINAGGGSAFGASYDVGNGFTFAFGYTGEGNADGLMTNE